MLEEQTLDCHCRGHDSLILADILGDTRHVGSLWNRITTLLSDAETLENLGPVVNSSR